MNYNKLNSINKTRQPDFDMGDWITTFIDNNDVGIDIKTLGLELKDFYNSDYQMGLDNKLDIKFGIEVINEKDNYLLNFSKKDYITIYKYISDVYGTLGYGSNTRKFCKKLMKNQDKVYSISDITAMNEDKGKANRKGGGGYSVLKYRGGVNCKHKWERYIYDPTTRTLIKKDVIQPKQIKM